MRRVPIRRGKLEVINSLWRPAVGSQSKNRVATLKHGRFREPFPGPPFFGVAMMVSDSITVTASVCAAEVPPPGEGLVTVI